MIKENGVKVNRCNNTYNALMLGILSKLLGSTPTILFSVASLKAIEEIYVN